ncbi:MAG: tRNA (adenosine(37)-N6)-dimethylallyltransferase MiaA [Proteobacteria bacterium]|nr:MAG: tRNA (adenosine(37)-N6)-dimethylallyltransferase MiaA [Pseudomonadota bacterium]
MKKPHLLFVVGTTAVGKSDFAVEVSELFNALHEEYLQPEIINTDSVAFFEGVQIGAAKPSEDLLARAPHHLVGHVKKAAKYTAGEFRRDALQLLEERNAECRNFLAVGGSGFYVQALEKGMYDVADPSEEVKFALAQDVAEIGMVELYEELRKRDPETHARLNANDHYRILRALEVLRSDSQGRTMGKIREDFERSRPPAPFHVSKIGLFRDRTVLREKVTERTRRMLKEGFIDEVIALREEGLGPWSPMMSVGYKEIQAMLDGELAKSELEQAIVTSTMQLAKSQMTWFKRDSEIEWFNPDSSWEEAKSFALAKLEEKA